MRSHSTSMFLTFSTSYGRKSQKLTSSQVKVDRNSETLELKITRNTLSNQESSEVRAKYLSNALWWSNTSRFIRCPHDYSLEGYSTHPKREKMESSYVSEFSAQVQNTN